MNKIIYVLLTAVAVTSSISASAEDLENVGQLDMSQIQQSICMANDVNWQSQSSLDNIGSILNETLALYSEGISPEQLQSARDMANQTVANLNIEASQQQLCQSTR